MDPSIFRAYDIRGVYGETLRRSDAKVIGLSFAAYLGNSGVVAVGRDVRASSKPLRDSLIEGLIEGGLKVIDIGVCSSPMLYFAVAHWKLAGGAMVTASHNPPEWNGFKLCRERGYICGEGMGMEEIRRIALSGEYSRPGGGSLEERSILEEYLEHAASTVEAKSLKVALDPGNGVCGPIARRALEAIGCTIVGINMEPDGRFPAHEPEPKPENLGELAELVKSTRADYGCGFDGDGDRAVFIDDLGRVLRGDVATAVFARYYLRRNPGSIIVVDVASSMAVTEYIEKLGGKVVVSRVGHAYIMDKMLELNAALGGEESSHLYFQEVYGFDDAVYACMKMAEVISTEGMKLSQLVDEVPTYPKTPILVYSCPDEAKFKVVELVKRELEEMGYRLITVDGVKAMGDEGWVLIRPSNTAPQIKAVAEAKDEAKLRELKRLADTLVEKCKRKLVG